MNGLELPTPDQSVVFSMLGVAESGRQSCISVSREIALWILYPTVHEARCLAISSRCLRTRFHRPGFRSPFTEMCLVVAEVQIM